MLEKSLLLKAKNIPNAFGVYLFLDKKNLPIYIGKSNKLKKRVVSYFNKKTEKENLIINHAHDINYFLVNNESDAFLLENTLIKKHQPKYNILLKDDKNYPWLCITKDKYPIVSIVRNKKNKNFLYFGPFLSYKKTSDLLNVIKKVYPAVNCAYITNKRFYKKKSRCLSCQINNCKGPCSGDFSVSDYNKDIESIKKLLKGKFNIIIKKLQKKMNKFSHDLNFEEAEKLKNQILSLKTLKNKSIVISYKNINIDSFFVVQKINYVYINFIRVTEGSVTFMKNTKSLNKKNWDLIYFLERFISNIYVEIGSLSKEIISNICIDSFYGRKIIKPKKGYKMDLLKLGEKNITNYINIKNLNNNDKLSKLKDDIYLDKIPYHIECFDISHLKGSYTTASCVVFKNGKPSKKDYRSFNIKSFKGINDYLAIQEALKRRYSKLNKLPDLIIIDGGKGQLSSSKIIFKILNISNVNYISIAKREEIIYDKKGREIILNLNSDSLKLIQNIRNEAHRFCLKNHRIKRSKNFIKSELNNIKNIGEKTVFKLLKKYKSVNIIKTKSKEEIIKFLGNKKGNIIYEHFNN